MTEPVMIMIVSGVSGSGKTTALRALEDRGYFCIDNLPSILIGKVVELGLEGHEVGKLALVIDIREGRFLQDLPQVVDTLRNQGHRIQIVFLDADDTILLRRFSETRRRHPLSPQGGVREGLQAERELLAPIRQIADRVLDTSSLTPHQLKQHVLDHVLGITQNHRLTVTLLSFGFRNGLPPEADLVLDVRFLPNPHFIPELRHFSGLNDKVSSYVLAFSETKEFLAKTVDLLSFLLPHYAREGKSYLHVAIGCTGGRHRSVSLTNAIADLLSSAGHAVSVRHRDLPAWEQKKNTPEKENMS